MWLSRAIVMGATVLQTVLKISAEDLRGAAVCYATHDKYTAIRERGRRVRDARCRHSRGSGPG